MRESAISSFLRTRRPELCLACGPGEDASALCRACGACARHCSCWGGAWQEVAGPDVGPISIHVVDDPRCEGPTRRIAILVDENVTGGDVEAAVAAALAWARELRRRTGPSITTPVARIRALVAEMRKRSNGETRITLAAIAENLNAAIDARVAAAAGITRQATRGSRRGEPPVLPVRFQFALATFLPGEPVRGAVAILEAFGRPDPAGDFERASERARRDGAPFPEGGPLCDQDVREGLRQWTKAKRPGRTNRGA